MPGENNYKFKFSFIMPIYKVEEYLEEAIASVLCQSMDFERDVELIFVNDGSPDNSEQICLKYKDLYPNNVKYQKQENRGVSVARNKGIEHAQGKYISFLDPDDRLSCNTLDMVYDFFERLYDEIDFVSIKLEFFDAHTASHPLNFKYKIDRIVDIEQHPDHIQLSSASIFVKHSALKSGKHLYPPSVKYSEDVLFVSKLLLNKMQYGVLKKPTYFYRRRQNASSAITGASMDKDWYAKTTQEVYLHLIKYAQNTLGYVPKYVQSLVAYDLQWRYRQNKQLVLNRQEEAEHKNALNKVLQYIDDDVILSQTSYNIEYKLFMLGKKHACSVIKKSNREQLTYHFNKQQVYDYQRNAKSVTLDIIDVDRNENSITLEGRFNGLLFNDAKLYFSINDERHEASSVSRHHKNLYFLGELVAQRNFFKVSLPISVNCDIKCQLIIGGHTKCLSINTIKFAKLDNIVGRAYRHTNGFILEKFRTRIRISKYRFWYRAYREFIYELALIKNKNKYIALYRALYFAARPFLPKNLWLLSDRPYAAGDNGEALFNYIAKQKDKKSKTYFAIAKNCGDYARLKSIGNVVSHGGILYKLLFLNAENVISSQADDIVINAFGKNKAHISDLYSSNFVFLQHGIIKDDLSAWLNKYSKNIQIFVTSTRPEYDSIVKGDYAYDESTVKLTGLPRYDLLSNAPKNKLIIAPTWRNNIATTGERETGERTYNPNFRYSEFFIFYNRLLNDHTLVDCLKSNNMTAEFYLHPAFLAQLDDFTGNDIVKIIALPYDYKTALSQGKLLLTDYSSIAFDFAYMHKPVIYTHFDKREFERSHTYKPGYFSYESDGFGPVTYSYESTLQILLKSVNGGCKLNELYSDRIDNFFHTIDKNNCARVYKEIVGLEKR